MVNQSGQVIPVNGIKLWYCEQGAGPPLVLCSGGPLLCDYLGPVAGMLDDLCRVYRYDSRGTGRSSITGPYDVATLLADLDGLRAALGHERWMVLGHSFGANLGLAYALDYPDRVEALIYLSGTGLQDDRQWHAAYEAGQAAGRDDVPAFDYPKNFEANQQGNTSWKAYIKQPDLLRRISMLQIPVLVLGGSEDIRPDWPLRQLAELLPQGRLVSIPGAGHCPWLSRPQALRDGLRDFIEGVTRSH